MDSQQQQRRRERLTIIGSGNWGSAIAKLAGENVLRESKKTSVSSGGGGASGDVVGGGDGQGGEGAGGLEAFEREVRMWVFEEEIEWPPRAGAGAGGDGDGDQKGGEKKGGNKKATGGRRKLTEVINEQRENVKYLPGIKLPDNVVAVPDLVSAVQGATALVFVLPHQFLGKVIEQLRGKIPSDGSVKGITLIKGVDVRGADIHIFADVIERELGVSCSSLSGANIADEVAAGKFSETTIGYRKPDEGRMWRSLFQTPRFRVQLIDDVAGVSLCGALKNIVAVAAGLSDGLGWGNNGKAAIMRIGLLESRNFCLEFFEGVRNETFLEESAGVADLITSCLGGRNRKCAEAFVKTGKPFEVLEEELLGGQKLQGIYTAREINEFLRARGRIDGYPLFKAVHQIAWEGVSPEKLVDYIQNGGSESQARL